jgi:hypothetical protein
LSITRYTPLTLGKNGLFQARLLYMLTGTTVQKTFR